MARSDTLPIFIDTYQFVRELYQITHKFPRAYKYCLGSRMNEDALMLLMCIFRANHSREQRRTELDAFLSALEMVRVEIRLCHDIRILSVRQMAHLALYTDKIARQATAWRKHALNNSVTKKEDTEKVLPESDEPTVFSSEQF